MLCAQHYQHFDEKLGYCWKCLAQERDPHNTVASWWWHLDPEVSEPAETVEATPWLKQAA